MKSNRTNFEIANSAMKYARSDHYNGVNAIYRLAASVPLSQKNCTDSGKNQVKWLVGKLSELKVKANRVNVLEETLEINFYPKGFQMVMTKGQYVGLLLEFAEFLDNSGILGIKIQEDCYNDAPDDSVKAVRNNQINFFPEFDSNCFGLNDHEKIRIRDCYLNLLSKEVA